MRIEQRPFLTMLTRFASPETFSYLDPPYVDFEKMVRYQALTPEDRIRLCSPLGGLKSRLLLSFDIYPEIHALVIEHGFQIEQVTTRYGLAVHSHHAGHLRAVD